MFGIAFLQLADFPFGGLYFLWETVDPIYIPRGSHGRMQNITAM